MVTIRLELFLDILIGSKDYSVVDKEVVEALKLDPTHTEHVFIEQLREDLFRVWRLKYWQISVERERLLKEAANSRRQRLLNHRAALQKASEIIAKQTSTDVETAKLFIVGLLGSPTSRNLLAQMVGAEMSEDEIKAALDTEVEKEPLPNL